VILGKIFVLGCLVFAVVPGLLFLSLRRPNEYLRFHPWFVGAAIAGVVGVNSWNIGVSSAFRKLLTLIPQAQVHEARVIIDDLSLSSLTISSVQVCLFVFLPVLFAISQRRADTLSPPESRLVYSGDGELNERAMTNAHASPAKERAVSPHNKTGHTTVLLTLFEAYRSSRSKEKGRKES
jgi:hypothetical protein